MISENRNDLKVLVYLFEKGINSRMKARKARTISEDEDVKLSDTKVRQTLNNYVNEGLVAKGCKEGKADTYFITEEGREYVADNFNINLVDN